MRFLISETIRRAAEDLSLHSEDTVEAAIEGDTYLEEAEKEKKSPTYKPSKDKEKAFKPEPKIRAPRRQPSYKNVWDSNEKRREYQQEYRAENGNGYIKKLKKD